MINVKSMITTLDIVIASCEEGKSGEWDCSTDEGKEGFDAMVENLEEVKQSVSKLRELIDECDTIFHVISLSGNHFKLTPQIERAINETWPKIGKALEKPTSTPTQKPWKS
jgi:hypothetical protein